MAENESPRPRKVGISAHFVGGPASVSARVNVVPADRLEVEDSSTLEYLRLRNGDIELPNSVFIVIDGNRHEITVEALPGDEQD